MNRIDLQRKLEKILGNKNVYFQAPSNVKMRFPAIRYKLDGIESRKANNKNYFKAKRYSLTHIYQDPDESLEDVLPDEFLFCSFRNRSYSDGLYNDSYDLYLSDTPKDGENTKDSAEEDCTAEAEFWSHYE